MVDYSIELTTDMALSKDATLRMLPRAVKIDGQWPPTRACSPLGGDGGALLAGAGFSPEQVRTLRDEKVNG